MIDIAHYLHVLAFALVLGVDLPAFYAAKCAAAQRATPEMRLMAARIVRWSGTISSAALALLLPLGVTIGADLGVYTVTREASMVATWLICGAWFVLVILADVLGASALGNRLHAIEFWVRIVIGAGNLLDGLNAFIGGRTPIQTNWLALKVTMLGLALIASALARRRFRPVRDALALINPMSAQNATWDERTAESVVTALKKTRMYIHPIFLFVLIAAWMGVTKSWE